MINNDCTIFIMSCDAFSDLWNGHVMCLNTHWKNRQIDAYIVSENVNRSFNGNVKGFSTKNPIWSERLKSALLSCETKYVFITLDDYFLIHDFEDDRFVELLNVVENNNLDYLRLFKRPKRATLKKIKYADKIYGINVSLNYSVNLYGGIWKREYLLSMIDKHRNPWQFEVELSRKANSIGCRGATDYNKNDYRILDVVRKGKLLRNAKRYFRRHPAIYDGDRPVNTFKYEFKLGVQTFFARHTPLFVHNWIKKLLRKKGRSFLSDFSDE